MKKLICLFLVLGIAISAFTQEEIPMNYISGKVTQDTEIKMKKGSIFIIDFYKNIGFPIAISKIVLRVFSSFDKYKYHQELNSNARSNNGYFSRSMQEIILYDNNRIMKTFHHEFNHYLLRSHFKNPPKWINEGLSEYFEYLNVADSCYISPQKKKMARIKKWISNDFDKDVEQVLKASNKQWTKQNIKPEYRSSTISYAIVFFLMSTEDGERIIGKILDELMNDKEPQDIFNSLYSGGFIKFNKDLIEFYKDWQ